MNVPKLVIEVAVLALIVWVETVVPLYARNFRSRWTHGALNIGFGLLGTLANSICFAAATAITLRWVSVHQIGLLNGLTWPQPVEAAIGFILFDLWMYLWHRANHSVAFLWRLHRVHHSDPAVDVTSAFRFHFGELWISSLLRLPIMAVLGLSLGQLILYEICLQPVILFHHSNVALSGRWDRRMRWVIVSPGMHRVHHSDWAQETNSNYASIFSIWDRLGKTWRRREEGSGLRFGLKELSDSKWQTFWGLVKTPWASTVNG